MKVNLHPIVQKVCVVLFGGIGVLLMSSCASIMHGTHQTIPVASIPAGAEVMINGAQVATTPGTIVVKRGENITLHFEKAGYAPMDVALSKKITGPFWGNLLLGGVIGIVVDLSNGAAYAQTPGEVNATMKELKATNQLPMKLKKNEVVVLLHEKQPGETITGVKISD